MDTCAYRWYAFQALQHSSLIWRRGNIEVSERAALVFRSCYGQYRSYTGWNLHLQLIQLAVSWLLSDVRCSCWNHYCGLVLWHRPFKCHASPNGWIQAVAVVEHLLEVPHTSCTDNDHNIRSHGLGRSKLWRRALPSLGGILRLASRYFDRNVDPNMCCQKYMGTAWVILRGRFMFFEVNPLPPSPLPRCFRFLHLITIRHLDFLFSLFGRWRFYVEITHFLSLLLIGCELKRYIHRPIMTACVTCFCSFSDSILNIFPIDTNNLWNFFRSFVI